MKKVFRKMDASVHLDRRELSILYQCVAKKYIGALGGICVEIGNGVLTLAATDLHRLAIITIPEVDVEDMPQRIIAVKVFDALLVSGGRSTGDMLVEIESLRTAPVIEGRLPRYREVIPTDLTPNWMVNHTEGGSAARSRGNLAFGSTLLDCWMETMGVQRAEMAWPRAEGPGVLSKGRIRYIIMPMGLKPNPKMQGGEAAGEEGHGPDYVESPVAPSQRKREPLRGAASEESKR